MHGQEVLGLWRREHNTSGAAVNVPFIGGGSGDVPVVLPLLPPVMADIITLPNLGVITTWERPCVRPAFTLLLCYF